MKVRLAFKCLDNVDTEIALECWGKPSSVKEAATETAMRFVNEQGVILVEFNTESDEAHVLTRSED